MITDKVYISDNLYNTIIYDQIRAKQYDNIPYVTLYNAHVLFNILYDFTDKELKALLSDPIYGYHIFTHLDNINAVSKQNWRPLHYAIRYSLPDNAIYLLKQNADVDYESHKGFRPIHIAVLHYNATVFRMIVERTPDINILHPEGDTTLALAIKNNNLSAVEILLNNNANTTIPDRNNEKLDVLAKRLAYDDIYNALIRHADSKPKTVQFNFIDHLKYVDEIIKKGNISDIHNDTDKNYRPLAYILINNMRNQMIDKKIYLLRKLLEYDIDIDKPFEQNQTNAYKVPLSFGIVSSKKIAEWSPIHIATYLCDIRIIRILIDAGININVYANVQYDKMDFIKYMSLSENTQNPKYTEYIAQFKHHYSTRQCIASYKPIHLAIMRNNDEVIKLIANYTSDYTENCFDGFPSSAVYLSKIFSNQAIQDMIEDKANYMYFIM